MLNKTGSHFFKKIISLCCVCIIAIASTNAYANKEYSYFIKRGDSLTKYFRKLNISNSVLINLLRANKLNKKLNNLQVGNKLNINLDSKRRFLSLSYRYINNKILRVELNNKRFVTNIISTIKPINLKNNKAKIITITKSLSHDANIARMSKKTVDTIYKAFSGGIDFRRDLRKGDKFIVISSNGKDYNSPAAVFYISGKKKITLFSYKNQNNITNYYNAKGRSSKRLFLRSPLTNAKISSRFNKRRYHPILKVWRPHRAIDYKAKSGTSVYAAASGIVQRRKYTGALGNAVFIKHKNNYVTVYAHLSRFAKSIRVGRAVKQGQVIGYVGSTGRSTGPHLHYELRQGKAYKNPLTHKISRTETINKADLTIFKQNASKILSSYAYLLK